MQGRIITLGVVLRGMGENDKAIECFKKALSIDPNFELAKKALEIVSKN